MKAKKIVITGGPSTGKTSIIDYLKAQGHRCFEEVSRSITLEARNEGIEQLFLTNPLLFSEKILIKRLQQYHKADSDTKNSQVFLDRGLPDVLAYMDYVKDVYPDSFIQRCKEATYDMVFIVPPWKEIYTTDNERYESFEQAVEIHYYLSAMYERLGYRPITIPKASIPDRCTYILDRIQ